MTTGEIDQLMARARVELGVVRLLSKGGFGEAAVSRAYYAAEAALLHVGQSRSTHGGVLSAFGHFIVLPGGVDRTIGRALRTLFDLRSVADYELSASSDDDVRTAAEQAQQVVDAVAAWLER